MHGKPPEPCTASPLCVLSVLQPNYSNYSLPSLVRCSKGDCLSWCKDWEDTGYLSSKKDCVKFCLEHEGPPGICTWARCLTTWETAPTCKQTNCDIECSFAWQSFWESAEACIEYISKWNHGQTKP